MSAGQCCTDRVIICQLDSVALRGLLCCTERVVICQLTVLR